MKTLALVLIVLVVALTVPLQEWTDTPEPLKMFYLQSLAGDFFAENPQCEEATLTGEPDIEQNTLTFTIECSKVKQTSL